MAIRTICPEEIAERTSYTYTGVLQKRVAGLWLPLPAAEVTTLTITLYSLADPTFPIVNAVNAVNILNVGRGTVDTLGNLVIDLTPDDNQILATGLVLENHLMLLQCSFASGTKWMRHEVVFPIRNLQKVT